jgi:hypothetical protein
VKEKTVDRSVVYGYFDPATLQRKRYSKSFILERQAESFQLQKATYEELISISVN